MTEASPLTGDTKSERQGYYAAILGLLHEGSVGSAEAALRLHHSWMEAHPDDIVALDAGEVISKALDSFRAASSAGELVMSR